jgi:type VI protein secretion system component Hcp
MGLRYFWYLEGLSGESTDPRYAGQIDISGFSYGGDMQAKSKSEGLGYYGEELASPYHITVMKKPDKTSNAILQAVFNARTFAHSVITIDRNGGNFIKIVMDDVGLMSSSSQNSTEWVSMNFKKVLLVNG